jgi:F-type H+-transporting ATPase subunit delta
MQGASRNSLASLRDQLADNGDLTQLSDQLFSVVTLLSSQASLRRALSDPSSAGVSKVRVVEQLFARQIDETALNVLRKSAESRWSQPRDLVDALEEIAVDAALITAETAGELDNVEDELFRFGRILETEPDLRAALTNRNLPADLKRDLLHRLLDGKVTAVTYRLLERAVIEPRGRTIETALRDLSALAAQRRERLIAHVTSAVELSESEQADLAAALGRTFGHDVRLQLVVDPALIGGLTVRVGDELIDASVARQLGEARRKLTGGTSSRS